MVTTDKKEALVLSEAQTRAKFAKMQSFTTISDGTLLTCCRQSKAFYPIKNHYFTLNSLRMTWLDYLLSQPETEYETWVDAWQAFEHYAMTEAIDKMKAMMIEKFEGKLLRTIKPTTKHVGYQVYASIMNETRIYNDGVMQTHKRKNSEKSFCATFLFSQKPLIKDTSAHE